MSVEMLPISTIKATLGIQENGPVHSFFTNECYKYMDKYVPLGDTGQLRQNVTLTANTITYEEPYAHYQYIGKLYVDPETGSPFARKGVKKVPTNIDLVHKNGYSYWDRQMVSADLDTIVKNIQNKFFGGSK